ncbi:MAG: guanyl-specific ribonuclease Sa [Cognaticolwellia sp.]|jgi:guanyl-specific ribonuclease Sa
MNLTTDTRSMLLPKHGQNYTECDKKPWIGSERGKKRIVIAAEKAYTSNHYANFYRYA